jgi:hypothetical protein
MIPAISFGCRRRRARWVTPVLWFLATGCPGGGGGGDEADVSTGSGGGGPACFDPFPWEIESAPLFRNVVTGVQKPSAWGANKHWTTMAYGHVNSSPTTTGCCFDYVVASDSDPAISVYLGADQPGLNAFGTGPSTRSIGTGGVVDLVLANVTGDGRNDLIALTTEDELEIFAGTSYTAPYFNATSVEVPATAQSGMTVLATGHSQVVAADIDCDDVVDIVMPADDGVVVRRSSGGVLNASEQLFDGVPVMEIAIADLDSNGSPDIIAGTEDWDVRVALNGSGNDCGAFANPVLYPFGTGMAAPTALDVAAGHVCPGHAGDLAIVVGHHDQVKVWCGDGSGTFDDVDEPHGEDDEHGFDYKWRLSDGTLPTIRDIAVFPGHAEIFTLAVTEAGRNVYMLAPGACGLWSDTHDGDQGSAQERIRPLTQPLTAGQAGTIDRLILQPRTNSDTTWRRALVDGLWGLQVYQ